MVDRFIAQEITSAYIDTGDGGKRHIQITSKGVVWFGMRLSGNLRFYRAASMTDPAYEDTSSGIANGVLTCAGEWSFCIDDGDKVHIVYAKYSGASSDGRTDKATLVYRQGVLNSTHTVITWSGEYALSGYDYWHSPDVVAHTYNGQHYAHVVLSYNWAGDNRTIVYYIRYRSNPNDVVNLVQEAAYFVHDVSGSQVFCPKPSIELRHDGDGKQPFRNTTTGLREPDVFITWTAVQDSYGARIRFNGTSWDSAEVWQINPDWANTTAGGAYGGLYEHHRWSKSLYDRRDDRWIYIGWMSTAGVGRQAMLMWEFPGRGSQTPQVGVAFPNMDWGVDANAENAVSGTATLDPQSNIEMVSCGGAYGTTWYATYSRRKILRPKGSNVRTIDTREDVQTGNTDSAGAHADILPYPPAGENHILWRHGNTWMYYWRNNRGANFVHTGSAVGRRPRYRLAADGSLVPIAGRTYT